METATDVDYFSHEADIGIIGRGKTVALAFVAAARAMFAIMADLSQLHMLQTITIEFEETDLELALVTWLNLLLAKSYSQGLILGEFKLIQNNSHWIGQAMGEPWREDLVRGTEVKGATLTMLSVCKRQEQWEAKCVVDV
ncbi:MAG TPA: archease [Gammaproteobacteria bacterium]|nr:archease [Gammaproteobacteria bacterium]